MSRARLIGALAVTALVLLWGAARRPLSATPDLTWTWRENVAARYHLTLEGESTIASPDGKGTLGGSMAMEGVLELARPAGPTPMLTLRLVSLERASMTLFGAPAMQDLDGLRGALVGPVAVLTLFPTGDVKQLAFSEGASTFFETTAQTVVSELQHAIREAPEYTLVETTTRGQAQAQWRRDGRVLHRTRPAYFTLTWSGGARAADVVASSRFEFDERGVLRGLESEERLSGRPPDHAMTSHLVVRLKPLDVEERAVVPPERVTAAPVGALKAPRDAEAQMLAQRIAGLDRQGLVKGLGAFSTSTGPGGLGAFMARASGLLLKQPELTVDVVAWARDPARSPRDREFALEVLAAAGTPAAQAAMLELLGDAVTTAAQVQRLSLVERPTAETARFVEARWMAAPPSAREPLSLTLGAVAGNLARSGHEVEARAAADSLRAALPVASTLTERVSLLFALGNAGLESHVDSLLGQLNDDDPRIRMAALHALRKTPTPAAHHALQAALTDRSSEVVREAVATLGLIPTSAADRAALISAARAGAVSLTTAPLVVTVLEPHLSTDPQVRPFLAWLATVENLDTPVRRRLITLLDPESNR